ncbi:hypothetical protein LC607_26375 [Nostoc sp. CHAB 5824]|nr:hypothetical protein [Nostoc sp. CHAB 5824]
MSIKDSFTSIKDSSASIKDSSATIKDSFTSIKGSFTSIKDSSASIKDSSASIKDSSASIKDSFTSIKDSSASIKDSFTLDLLQKSNIRPKIYFRANSSSRFKPTNNNNFSPFKRTFAISLGLESLADQGFSQEVYILQ